MRIGETRQNQQKMVSATIWAAENDGHNSLRKITRLLAREQADSRLQGYDCRVECELVMGPIHDETTAGDGSGNSFDHAGELFQVSIQVGHGSADLSDIIPSSLVRPLGPLEFPAAQTESIIPLSR